MERSNVILICVAGYLVTWLSMGLWAMKRTSSARDFFVAGRDLGIVVTGIAVFSGMMSGFGFVGGPGLVYRMGMSSVWIVVAAPIGYCLTFFLLGKRLRLLGELCDSVSLPDVVAARYSSEPCQLLTALAILLGMVGLLSWFFWFAVGAVGQPHLVTKFMIFRRIADVRYILFFTIS